MANENDDIPPIPVPPVEAPPTAAAPVVPPIEAPEAPPAAAAPAAPVAATVPPAYTAPAYAAQPAGPVQGLSIASMVCGIAGIFLSFFWIGFLPALAAVITGHLAQKRQPYAKPFWLTGIITGYVGIAISLVYLLFVIVIAVVGFTSYNQYGY